MPVSDTCRENFDPLKLVRDGTHQAQRLIAALDPDYAPVSDRDVANGLMFAKHYSEFLNYYNTSNTVDGNWEPFFNSDPSVILATCAVQNVEFYKSVVQASFDFLNDIENDADIDGVRTHTSWLFSYAATFVQQMDAIQASLPAEISLRNNVRNVIFSKLANAFARLISYYKADLVLPVADRLILSTVPTDDDMGLVLLGASPVSFASVLSNGLSEYWITDANSDWTTFVNDIDAEASVYGDSSGTAFERANHASTHNLFSGVFDQILKSLSRLVIDAEVELQNTLTSYDKHEPHYALFLSFLQLLEHARETINTLTARHLDFYYRDILQLGERAAQPSVAHLLLEPAKNIESYEVAAGTRFKAKDSSGNEVFFANDTALIVNQATVSSMKKVFRHEGELFSALIANSDDGVTDVLKADDKSWHPFFNKTFTDGVLTSVDMPPATVGFFIASHYFLLAEGQRTVAVTFTASGFKGTIGQEYATGVLCSLSGEKGWFDVQPTSFKATNATTIVLQVVVDGDQPAVVASDTKLHAITIDTPTPLLKLTFQHIDGEDFLFELFEDVAIGTVTVNVSVDRVRALTLSNDFGPVDASKPFQPFGAQPEAGSSFVIGSQEIFSKRNLNTCQLILNWKNIPNFWVIAYRLYEESFSKFIDYYNKPFDLASAIEYIFYALSVPQVMVQALSQGVWNVGTLRNIFDSDSSITIDIKPPSNAFNVNDESDFQVDDAYAVTTKNAFMRLNLTSGFGHVQFRDALADYALDVASGGSPVKPTAPYTPEVDSIYATYSATQTFQCDTSDEDVFNNRQARLFHITDFGFAEQHAVLKQDTPDTAVYLFPQLRHSNQFDDAIPDGQSVVHEAEFFIGVKGLVPPQTLTFLFQCVDGTANPLSLKPDPHIQWSYLQNNEWMPFQANDVQDNTAELLESGIVTLSVPREATSDNTLFTTGLHWFRLAVEKNSDAVCSLILVATQALEVDLQDVAVDAVVEALAANTISKLEKPVAAVKKVSQPSPTFGGKSAEDPNDFYARISERLRHKDRAITIWDYEHLVLEAYPEIYRVKCLNHTQYEPSDDVTGIYKELAPGHVTIITIPDQIGQNEANPLKPYTSLGLLEEIYDYLKARLTCFATLHVRNPQFEEVRVDFKVRLYDGFDETFYVNKLKESITQFLSPWAYSNIEHPSFGGKIYQSVLVDFVEEQEYVDYVTDFHLFHDIGGVQSTVSRQFVEGSRAVSILVSVPASKHTITVIDPIEEEVSLEECGCDE